MMKSLQVLLIIIPFLTFGQVTDKLNPILDEGIRFTSGMNWEGIKAKAKSENRFIFLDCFTTWCGPCRRMDKDIYVNDSVGFIFNNKFISVKVQMDRTTTDNDEIRSWYFDALLIAKTYKVNSYPTYLFFSPDGILVEKQEGFKPINDFISIAKIVLTPGKKYDDPYSEYDQLVRDYRKGKKDYSKIPYLYKISKELNNINICDSLLSDYYSYISQGNKRELYTKNNIEFIASLTKHSNDEFFKIFYYNGKKINKVMAQLGFSERVVDKVIRSEYTDSFLVAVKKESEPNWRTLYKDLKSKYSKKWCERAIIAAKVKWYEYSVFQRDAKVYKPLYLKYFIEQVKKFGIDGISISLQVPTTVPYVRYRDYTLNKVAWWIFESSNDKEQILYAINWMHGVAKRSLSWSFEIRQAKMAIIDTYANLLYKAGKTKEAIQWEEQVLKSAEESNDKKEIKKYQEYVEKMKNEVPTWPVL